MALMLLLLVVVVEIPKWVIILLWINFAIAFLGALFLSLIAMSVDATTFEVGGAQTAAEDEISAQSEKGENIAWLHTALMAILGIPAILIILLHFHYWEKKKNKQDK